MDLDPLKIENASIKELYMMQDDIDHERRSIKRDISREEEKILFMNEEYKETKKKLQKTKKKLRVLKEKKRQSKVRLVRIRHEDERMGLLGKKIYERRKEIDNNRRRLKRTYPYSPKDLKDATRESEVSKSRSIQEVEQEVGEILTSFSEKTNSYPLGVCKYGKSCCNSYCEYAHYKECKFPLLECKVENCNENCGNVHTTTPGYEFLKYCEYLECNNRSCTFLHR